MAELNARTRLLAELREKLALGKDLKLTDEQEFWRRYAVASKLADGPTAATAKLALETRGIDWEDAYLAEDGALSIQVYEQLLGDVEAVGAEGTEGADGADDDDDTDDDPEGVVELHSLRATHTPMTISDLVSKIRKGRIALNPPWQRPFVWKKQRMQRLIESILLQLPIPSILLYVDENGQHQVVDGRQRLETIYRFHNVEDTTRRFKTPGVKTPGWGPGGPLNEAAGCYFNELPARFQTRFEDLNPLSVSTFEDISPRALYQVFKRYNTGSVKLRPSEIRNAVYQSDGAHQMMMTLAGHITSAATDGDDAEISAELKIRMKSKYDRYGGADFLGRYFAFTRMEGGTVATATNAFLQKNKEDPAALKKEFAAVFRKTLDWYPKALTAPTKNGHHQFHAFLATIQLVATRAMLQDIEAGKTTEAIVRQRIDAKWPDFWETQSKEKQNATRFWGAQGEWIAQLRSV